MKNKKFDIVLMDPPWEYKGGFVFTETSSARNHYSVDWATKFNNLPLTDIVKDDSLLFMWATAPKLGEAIDLMEELGWTYKTIAFVWEKVRTNPGYYTLSSTEYVLVGKRGKIPGGKGGVPVRNIRQFLQEKRSKKHSEKPEEIQNRIEAMFDPNKFDLLEVFARRQRPNWTCAGNELDGLDIFDWVDKWSKDEIK